MMTLKQQRTFKNKINELMLNNECLIIYFVFDEESMKKTNSETRKRYIKTFLNEQTNDYILIVIDSKNYKAIAKAKYKNMIYPKAFKYGTIKADKISQKTTKEKTEKITKKAINKKSLVIYGRNKTAKPNPYEREIEDIIMMKIMTREQRKIDEEISAYFENNKKRYIMN